MKKLLLVLSLGLAASSMSLQAKSHKKVVMNAADDVTSMIQDKLGDMDKVEGYLKGKSEKVKKQALSTWKALVGPLSENLAPIVSKAKKAGQSLNVADTAQNLGAKIPSMLKPIVEKNIGKAPSFSFSSSYAKKAAQYTADVAKNSASDLASIQSIIQPMLNDVISDLNDSVIAPAMDDAVNNLDTSNVTNLVE